MMYIENILIFPTISIITVLTITSIATSKPAPTRLIVTRVGPCFNSDDTKIAITEMTIERNEAYHFKINGWLFIKENLSSGWDVKVTVEKCLDLRNLDTCDTFRYFPVITGGCSAKGMGKNIDLYGAFVYTTPSLACPIQVGAYKVSYPYYSEDNDLIVPEAKISTSVFGYKVTFTGFERKKTIMCVEAYLQLMYIRKHKWIDVKKQGTEANRTTKPTQSRQKQFVKKDLYDFQTLNLVTTSVS